MYKTDEKWALSEVFQTYKELIKKEQWAGNKGTASYRMPQLQTICNKQHEMTA